ncbi:MAG: hypothetical protein SGPRY_004981 [Prymnesium sp.]
MAFAQLDVFPKTLQEFRHRTQSGAIVSIICASLIALLSLVEISDFWQASATPIKTIDRLSVDTSRDQKLLIYLNLTFPALPCSVLSLDAHDLSGNDVAGPMPHIKKSRLDAFGNVLDEPTEQYISTACYVMPAYMSPLEQHEIHPSMQRHLLFDVSKDSRGPGAIGDGGEQPARKQSGFLPAEQLSKNFKKHDLLLSSLLSGLMPSVFEDQEAIAELKKHMVKVDLIDHDSHYLLDFHFALQKAERNALISVYKNRESLNVSHIINSISFGDPYPGMVNPLEGSHKILSDGSGYFHATIHTNQYSYTELFRTTKDIDKLPGISIA